MRTLRSYALVILATVFAVIFFWFRPGGVDGPRPAPVAATGVGFDHGAFTVVLQQAVGPDGQVDYAALRADPARLDDYLGRLRATSPVSAPHRFKSDDDRLAYYLNAYNAMMLAAVRDHCPVEDVQTVYVAGGLFWRVSFLLGEVKTTLSDLESHQISELARQHPAVHFALVKGARGYPALPRAAYEGPTLRAQLDALARQVVHDPAFVRRAGDTLQVSMIFQWYLAHFGGDALKWIQSIAPEVAEGATTVEFIPVDGALNGRC